MTRTGWIGVSRPATDAYGSESERTRSNVIPCASASSLASPASALPAFTVLVNRVGIALDKAGTNQQSLAFGPVSSAFVDLTTVELPREKLLLEIWHLGGLAQRGPAPGVKVGRVSL